MKNFTLGLDLGANSIGWAVIDREANSIVGAGVRVFPEGVENFNTKKEKSKTEARRDARAARRQTARRSRRKRNLRQALVAAGLLPEVVLRSADDLERIKFESDSFRKADPYQLRLKALSEKLDLYEIGRVLLHLNRRRGFLSNRKTDKKKNEDKGILAEMNQLAADMKQAGHQTLGEHLGKLHQDPHCRIRKRHTRREMFEAEFEAIWETQRKHYPKLLTDELKYGTQGRQPYPCKSETAAKILLQQYGLHGLIFFQRKMYWPKSVIGQCELEPREKRCPRADRLAQRFRLLQEVNNLRFIDPDSGEVRHLSPEHRTLLLDKLSRKKEMKFDEIRKALGFIESIRFNLEEGGRDKLQGMETDALLGKKGIFGPAWHEKPEDWRNEVVQTLIDSELEEREVNHRAENQWGLDPAATEKLLDAVKDLPQGHLHLSRLALTKLLPHMERGLLLMSDDHTPSAMSEAGYLRKDQLHRGGTENLPEPPDVTNPVVRQALFEVRKVVNAIIREYGKPGRIHIELAREARVSAKERTEISRRMRERELDRDKAANAIREHGAKVTRDAINRYLLWEEQGRNCVYSGQSISLTQLLGGEVDIDHILPYSRCLDDSMNNKVLCFRPMNAEKGQRTPWEWLGTSDPDRFEQIRQHVARLPFTKRVKFTQKELKLDEFIQRQLNDTRYISVVVMDYLRHLVDEPHYVLCPKGEHTASLRRQWGLNTILRDDGENAKSRDDHRHHAVDAIVLALTDHSRLQQLSRRGDEEALPEPWPEFRATAEKVIKAINVSHRVQRKVAGPLHNDFLYGPTAEPLQFVRRKEIRTLEKTKQLSKIRDAAIRDILKAHIRQHGIDPDSPGEIPSEVWNKIPTMKSGIPIRKVRMLEKGEGYREIRPGQCVELANNHHMEVYELIDKQGRPLLNKDGMPKREGVLVSMLDAATRIKDGNPVVNRKTLPDRRFVMSLSINEMLEVEMPDGSKRLHRVQKMDINGSLVLRPHTYAGKVSDTDKPPLILRKTANTLRGRKVTVDPLGRIRWAND